MKKTRRAVVLYLGYFVEHPRLMLLAFVFTIILGVAHILDKKEDPMPQEDTSWLIFRK